MILAHSQFEKIPISTERQIAMLERQINDIENAIHEIKSENGENWSVKQMVIFRKNLDERLKKLSAEEKKDDLLTFEQLGVDMMMVDEAHFFKNCFVFTKLRNVAGITTSSSQRAFDMLLKCQYLQETNQGRGVVFATGTPISNSISELFVMQRYLQPQELERFGWSYFDTWIAHFAKKASVLELKPEGGGYRMRDRFVRFYNLPELMAVFREVADIKTADMLDIPGLPAVRTGKAEIVSVEATPAQQAIMADFILRAEAIRTGRVKPEEDNMLKLTGEARLMAIDPRLIRPDADGTGSKLSVCIEDVYQVWKDTAASASTQLVFCDVGTPKAGKFNVYDEIRNVLLAKGVPESEIAFVHDATSEAQRQELFERTRQGKVRILIGSTSKLGTGVNVQNKVISIDHLDCPWKPSDITQRNGRGVRQGNENPEIMIKQFVAKGTFDAYLWQIQEQKLRYITQILTGKHIARSCEDVDETVLSAAQFKAAATDNPMVAQKMELENRVTELKILRGAWSNEQLALEHKVNLTYPSRIREYEQKIERVTQDISLLGQTEGKDFSIVLDGKHYTERPAAGDDTTGAKGLAGSHIPKQQQAGVVSVCLLPVLHIGAGLVHQRILAVVVGKGVVVQIAVLQALGLPALDTLHAALPFLGGLTLFLSLPLALADTAGHEVAGFPKAWHNGLPLAAALLTVNEAVCRVYVLVPPGYPHRRLPCRSAPGFLR